MSTRQRKASVKISSPLGSSPETKSKGVEKTLSIVQQLGPKWDDYEVMRISRFFKQKKKDWEAIAKLMPGRTSSMVKHIWNLHKSILSKSGFDVQAVVNAMHEFYNQSVANHDEGVGGKGEKRRSKASKAAEDAVEEDSKRRAKRQKQSGKLEDLGKDSEGNTSSRGKQRLKRRQRMSSDDMPTNNEVEDKVRLSKSRLMGTTTKSTKRRIPSEVHVNDRKKKRSLHSTKQSSATGDDAIDSPAFSGEELNGAAALRQMDRGLLQMPPYSDYAMAGYGMGVDPVYSTVPWDGYAQSRGVEVRHKHKPNHRGSRNMVPNWESADDHLTGTQKNHVKTLVRCLSMKMKNWTICEWFYASIDKDFFSFNELYDCLHNVDLGHVSKLTRTEWASLRSTWGRPRRLSRMFLQEERMRLNKYRDNVRRVQQGKELPPELCAPDKFPYEVPAPLSVEMKVTAIHPKQRRLQVGEILTADFISNRYRVQFERPTLGVKVCEDTEIMPHGQLKVIRPRLHTGVKDYTNELNTFGNKIEKNGACLVQRGGGQNYYYDGHGTPLLFSGQTPLDGALAGRTNSGARPSEIKLLAFILKLMDRKEYLLAEIRFLNTHIEEMRGVQKPTVNAACVQDKQADKDDRVSLKSKDSSVLTKKCSEPGDQKSHLMHGVEVRTMNYGGFQTSCAMVADLCQTKVDTDSLHESALQNQYNWLVENLRNVNKHLEPALSKLRQMSIARPLSEGGMGLAPAVDTKRTASSSLSAELRKSSATNSTLRSHANFTEELQPSHWDPLLDSEQRVYAMERYKECHRSAALLVGRQIKELQNKGSGSRHDISAVSFIESALTAKKQAKVETVNENVSDGKRNCAGARMISSQVNDLATACVTLLLATRACASRGSSPGEVGKVLEMALSKIKPACEDNNDLYQQIARDVESIRNVCTCLL